MASEFKKAETRVVRLLEGNDKRPYINIKTNKIKYLSDVEYLFHSKSQWVEIEETEAIRILYGSK